MWARKRKFYASKTGKKRIDGKTRRSEYAPAAVVVVDIISYMFEYINYSMRAFVHMSASTVDIEFFSRSFGEKTLDVIIRNNNGKECAHARLVLHPPPQLFCVGSTLASKFS